MTLLVWIWLLKAAGVVSIAASCLLLVCVALGLAISFLLEEQEP